MDDFEIQAALYGGQMAGEYMAEINKTDLATFTPEEWQTFLTVITHNYHLKHSELRPCPF